jgi:hypothetical protein
MQLQQWKKRVEKCSVEQALKSIFIDFLALDYMPVEFLNVAWDSTCEIQISRLIS